MNFWAIFKRELRSYFVSPIFYAVAIIFLLVSGFFFFNFVRDFIAYGMMATQQAAMMRQQMPPLNMNEWIVRPFFYNSSVILLFFIPVITMRLFAEERKSGTFELLLTKPVTDLQIILGKFFASFVLFAVIIALTFFYMIILFFNGTPDVGPIFTGYLGLLLLGATLLALGSWISSLTDNQIVAAFGAFGLFLILFVLSWSGRFASESVTQVIDYVSIMGHFDDLAKGVIDTKDVIYYLSFIFFALYLNLKSIESLRWRG